jgi:uncharacterized protein
MTIFNSIDPLFSLSGFLVGALVGMTGVGGGSLMTPLLILLFGVHPATAVGTDLLYASATKTVGTAVHGVSRTVDWRVVGRLAAGSVPMTAMTLYILAYFGADSSGANTLINAILSLALFTTASALIFRKRIVERYGKHFVSIDDRRTRNWTITVGMVLGVLVSISSVGAGAIGVTALILLYPRLPMARIVGSDIAHAVPLTLIAGAGHWLLGLTDAHILFSLLVGSIPGIILGSYLVPRMPEAALRYILAGTLIVVGARLAF